MRTDSRIEDWLAGLGSNDRLVTCTIVRGEVLFGIAKLPAGKRRAELEETGSHLLAALRCEPVAEEPLDFVPPLNWLVNETDFPWTKTIYG